MIKIQQAMVKWTQEYDYEDNLEYFTNYFP